MVHLYIPVYIFHNPFAWRRSFHSYYLKLFFGLLPVVPHATHMSGRLPSWSRKDTSKAPLVLAFRSSKGFRCIYGFVPLQHCEYRRPQGGLVIEIMDSSPTLTSALLGCYAGSLTRRLSNLGWLTDRFLSRRLPCVPRPPRPRRLDSLTLRPFIYRHPCPRAPPGVVIRCRSMDLRPRASCRHSGPERDRESDGLLFIVQQHCCPSRTCTRGIVFAQSGYLAVFAMALRTDLPRHCTWAGPSGEEGCS
jgi:hypothetical protein